MDKKDIIIYTDNTGNVRVEAYVQNETIWLAQKGMANLFKVKVPAIAKHLKNIYQSEELNEKATISILETVQIEGKRKIIKLERTIASYFDYIENQVEVRKEINRPFTMEELAESVNKFLNFNDFKVLENKGKVSHQTAVKKAENEYFTFNKTQKIDSDFDKFVRDNIKRH